MEISYATMEISIFVIEILCPAMEISIFETNISRV